MFLSGEELVGHCEDLIHAETQKSDFGLDLTVRKISRVETVGALDFGGSEERQPDLSLVKPTKRSSDDEYGWWDLEAGTYIIHYNESLHLDNEIGFVLPLPRLVRAGASHLPVVFRSELVVTPILHVGSSGLEIKENARTSQLLAWR